MSDSKTPYPTAAECSKAYDVVERIGQDLTNAVEEWHIEGVKMILRRAMMEAPRRQLEAESEARRYAARHPLYCACPICKSLGRT